MSLGPLVRPFRAVWSKATRLADQTPATRNRYVDFLRAVSILAVVLGHWLMVAASTAGGSVTLANVLSVQPATHGLTLLLQVMPIFFFVGGYANGVAWDGARKKGIAYGPWLSGRLQRLLSPLLPLLGLWLGVGAIALALGVDPAQVGAASQVALVPTWFLAVYVLVAIVVPWTFAAWRRFGWLSVGALFAGAAIVDAVGLGTANSGLRYLNYAFVWLGVHQLGYAWYDGRLAGRRRLWGWALTAAVVTTGLIAWLPYPLAMVGVPGQPLSNSQPPTLALLAFGVTQISVALLLEAPMRRWLSRRRVWAATVLVNGQIMTLYLWHMTALVLAVGAAMALGGIGLEPAIAGPSWWLLRPVWLSVYGLAVLPFLLALARFERPRRTAPAVSHGRLAACASLACLGIVQLVTSGVVGATAGGASLRVVPVLMPFVGSGLAAFGPLARVLQPRSRGPKTPHRSGGGSTERPERRRPAGGSSDGASFRAEGGG